MTRPFEPITLTGAHVELRPMSLDDPRASSTRSQPFTVHERSTGRVLGASRFGDIDPA